MIEHLPVGMTTAIDKQFDDLMGYREVRPFIPWAADLINACLERNDDKPAWETESLGPLFEKLVEELFELKSELMADRLDTERIQSEASDVAAVAMMIAARVDTGDPSRWRRGRELSK